MKERVSASRLDLAHEVVDRRRASLSRGVLGAGFPRVSDNLPPTALGKPSSHDVHQIRLLLLRQVLDGI